MEDELTPEEIEKLREMVASNDMQKAIYASRALELLGIEEDVEKAEEFSTFRKVTSQQDIDDHMAAVKSLLEVEVDE